MQQGFAKEPGGTEMVGGHAVLKSPLEGLAKLASVYAGKRGVEKAVEGERQLGERVRGDARTELAALMMPGGATAVAGAPPVAPAAGPEQLAGPVDEPDPKLIPVGGGAAPIVPVAAPGGAVPVAAAAPVAAATPVVPAVGADEKMRLAMAMGSPHPQVREAAAARLKILEHDSPSGSAILGADVSREATRSTAATAAAGHRSAEGIASAGHRSAETIATGNQAVQTAGQQSTAATAQAGHKSQEQIAAEARQSAERIARGAQATTHAGNVMQAAATQATAGKPNEAQVQAATGATNTKDAIAGYRDVLKNFDYAALANPARVTEINSLYNNMLLHAKDAYRLGVLSKEDLKTMSEVITSPTSLRGVVSSRETLDKQAQTLDKIMSKVIERSGTGATRVGGTSAPAGSAGAGASGTPGLTWQDALKRHGG